jgi:hypothetical protein
MVSASGGAERTGTTVQKLGNGLTEYLGGGVMGQGLGQIQFGFYL